MHHNDLQEPLTEQRLDIRSVNAPKGILDISIDLREIWSVSIVQPPLYLLHDQSRQQQRRYWIWGRYLGCETPVTYSLPQVRQVDLEMNSMHLLEASDSSLNPNRIHSTDSCAYFIHLLVSGILNFIRFLRRPRYSSLNSRLEAEDNLVDSSTKSK